MGNDIEVSAREGRLAIPGIVVTSVQQLQSRLKSSETAASVLMDSCQVMIIDEVHRNLDWNEALFREFNSRDNPPGVIGLTATPFRRESHESARLAKAFGSSVIAPVKGGERDPDMVANQLKRMIEVLGLDGIAAEFNAGETIEPEKVSKSLKLFCEEVAPNIG